MTYDDDPTPSLIPSPLSMAIAFLAALLISCLWTCLPARGAPAPFPRQPDPRPLERARKALVGRWAMCWSGGAPHYVVDLDADGRYTASDHTTTYTGTWTLSRQGRNLVLTIRERVVWRSGECVGVDPGYGFACYRFVLDQKDVTRGRHEGQMGAGFSFRLSPRWQEDGP